MRISSFMYLYTWGQTVPRGYFGYKVTPHYTKHPIGSSQSNVTAWLHVNASVPVSCLYSS